MIPSSINDALTLYVASMNAASPLAQASRLTVAALQKAGTTLVVQIDAAMTPAAGALDANDPAGFPGDLVTDLLGLASAAEDQSALADIRGLVGRALFNLNQVPGAA